MSLPDRSTFEAAYGGQAPWDIGRPQQAFVNIAGQVSGTVLDVGCGTGENALYFASRGHIVTGIDFLAEPIGRAKRKAAERLVMARFLVLDALTAHTLAEQFDTLIDCGLFHIFSDESRAKYVSELQTVTKPGGRLFLLCFSDAEPGTQGPRRISRKQIESAFQSGWTVESIEPSCLEVRPDLTDITFSPGGPRGWFATIKRNVEVTSR